jgi:uncharacterized protein (TIGR02466 family)
MPSTNQAVIVPLFSSPVYCRYSLEFNAKKIIYFLEESEWEETEYKNGFNSKNQNILLEDELLDIKNIVEENLRIYIHEFLKISTEHTLKHCCSWAMRHGNGDCAQLHMHKNSMYSGVIYLKVPEDSGNHLIFEINHNQPTYSTITASPNIDEQNIYNSRSFSLFIEDKSIAIFPSHMHHKTLISQSKENRYCIAFNYFLGGRYGGPTSSLVI